MNSLVLGFVMILIAAVAGGAFGLQYRIMRKYTVENSSLLSLFFATIVVPLIACHFLLPGWTEAIGQVSFTRNLSVFGFGFGWGLGAITYAYGFNILGMALAAALLKGLTIALGSGIPLIRHWEEIPADARKFTIVGLAVLIVGTAFAGKAGIMREKELSLKGDADQPGTGTAVISATGKVFLVGLLLCLVSGLLSAFVNLGYDLSDSLEEAMTAVAGGEDLTWKATLIRWMPMYWGGITALILFMGGSMLKNGTWRNYFAAGTARDFFVSSSSGIVHFFAQIPYGIGAYYLGSAIGTTVGWGVNIGIALIVASAIGFMCGEWKNVSKPAVRTLLGGIAILLGAMAILAYANSLALLDA